MQASLLNPVVQVAEAVPTDEGLRFGAAYGDLLEVCRHMEIKQDIGRHVIVRALLATVETLRNLPEGSVETTLRRNAQEAPAPLSSAPRGPSATTRPASPA